MRTPCKLTALHNSITRSSSVLLRLFALGLALAIVALALVAQRRFAVTAQEPSQGGAPNINLVEIASDPNGSTGIAHHQPSNSLLLSSGSGVELFGADGARIALSRIGVHQGRLASVRESGSGFTAGEVFAGADSLGAIVRLSLSDLPDTPRAQNSQSFWTVLEGEIGLVSGLYFDRWNSSTDPSDSCGTVLNSDLIAVTTAGGVWRIDSAGNARRVTAMITARPPPLSQVWSATFLLHRPGARTVSASLRSGVCGGMATSSRRPGWPRSPMRLKAPNGGR